MSTEELMSHEQVRGQNEFLLASLHNSFELAMESETPGDVLGASLAEAFNVVENRGEVLRAINELSDSGRNFVFVGGNKQRDNLIFALMGAVHHQVGDRCNVFVVPSETFHSFIRSLSVFDPATDVAEEGATKLIEKVREELPIE